jgi:hypothetical protein
MEGGDVLKSRGVKVNQEITISLPEKTQELRRKNV